MNTNCSLSTYNYLIILAMIYLSCELSSLVLSFKIIETKLFFGAAASLIFPITYTLNDIITEVYGFNTTRKVIWFIFICDYLFVLLVFLAIKVPSPILNQQDTYEIVFGSLWRSLSSEMLGVLVGAFINSIVISKWKIIARGKQFWLRSICSSAIGEILMLLISVPIALYNVLTFEEMMKLIGYAYFYKIFFAIAISGPANYCANLLKAKEGIDIFDYNVNYNPFRDKNN